MRKPGWRKWPFLLAFYGAATCSLFINPAPAIAQTATGEMTITVTDSSGAAVPGAQVKIIGTDTGASVRSLSSNASGLADIPLLQPGRYTTIITAPGFKVFTRSAVSVSVGNIVDLHIALQIGANSQSVVVTGDAPLVEDKSEVIAQVIQSKQLLGLPLNGRNYLDAANLSPGVVPTAAGRDNTFSAFGNSGLQNSFLLDGTRNVNYIRGLDNHTRDMVRPPLDALSEFTVQTSNFSAEYGAAAGAVINAITRSGTNKVHGSAYDFFQNSSLDAANYFSPTKPLLVRNQYGGSLGGPIIRDHAWLFGAYEGIHQRTESPATTTVPTALERTGDFAESINPATGQPLIVYDPSTTTVNGTTANRTAFANDTIPLSRLNPVTQALAALYPLPNDGGNRFVRNVPNRQDNKNGVVRGDVQISTNDSIFARYSRQSNETSEDATLPAPAQDPGTQSVDSDGVGFGYTHIFSSTLVNEFRFGYTGITIDSTGTNPRNEVIPGSLDPAINEGTPLFNVSSFAGLGAEAISTSPIRKSSGVWDWSDNLSKTLGKHNVKVGGEVLWILPSTFSASNGRTTFGFTGVFTQNPASRGTTGSGLADLLLGDAATLTTGTVAQNEERGWYYGVYATDQWTATRNLTLDYGLRYEYTTPYIETQNRMANFILDPGSPLFGQLIFSGDHRLPRSLIDPDRNNFAPRLGFAYRVPQVNNLSIRGSFGLFYGQDEGTGVTNRLTSNPPFFGYGSQTISSDQLDPATGFILSPGISINRPTPVSVANFTLVPSATSRLTSWPTHLQMQYVEQWNLSVQKQLPYNILFEATYVGNHGVHLIGIGQGNQPIILNATPVNSRRPLAQYTDAPVTQVGDWNGSNYNGLAVKLERRYSNGFQLLTSLTYGHSLDLQNEALDLCDTCGAGDTIQNNYDHGANYGNADNDVRFRYVLSGVVELPFGYGKPYLNRGVTADIVGGWALSPIYTYQTGNYFTPALNYDAANAGTITRPDQVCNGNTGGGPLTHYFDTSCFLAPPSYTFGNAGRNILKGPPGNQLNLSLQRDFPLNRLHGAILNIRLDAFDVFNHPQFGNPGNTVGNALYGVISSAGAPRQVQVAARLSF